VASLTDRGTGLLGDEIEERFGALFDGLPVSLALCLAEGRVTLREPNETDPEFFERPGLQIHVPEILVGRLATFAEVLGLFE
jgi:hypothetical protein